MKKQLLTIIAILFAFTGLYAQDSTVVRQTAEDRIKSTMVKMESLGLSETVKPQVETVVRDFYNAQHAYMLEVRASGTFDREAVNVKREQLTTDRDNKLKVLLTAEQYKKWKEELEPALRPQRRGN